MIPVLLGLVIGYLIGSIPFGLIVTRLAGIDDIRKGGSGNIGATNVLRQSGKKLAAITLVLDVLKGAIGPFMIIGSSLMLPAEHLVLPLALIVGAAAVLGHLYPVWLGFNGGKGVATYLGFLAAIAWPVALAFGITWIVLAVLTRYSSIASLGACGISVVLLAFFATPLTAGMFASLYLLIFWRHRENLSRLRAGSENRIGQDP